MKLAVKKQGFNWATKFKSKNIFKKHFSRSFSDTMTLNIFYFISKYENIINYGWMRSPHSTQTLQHNKKNVCIASENKFKNFSV